MNIIDYKKDPTYKAKPEPEIIDVPKMTFVMVDGEGAPETSEAGDTAFQQAMKAIYGIVYGIKFWDKKHSAPPGYAKFTMPPVEGLWWTISGGEFDTNNPDDWKWTAMHRLPEFVTPQFFQQVVEEMVKAKETDIFRIARLEYFEEGPSAQLMHIGPYNQEGPNIKKLHDFIHENGHELRGRHHELYFGDPRRTAPEKLKTILRQPLKWVSQAV